MTAVNTELDFSVLEDLDFQPSCAMTGHGEDSSCDDGPAVWIARKSHKCDPKTLPICDKFKRVMEEGNEEFVRMMCGCVVPFKEFFEVVGRV